MFVRYVGGIDVFEGGEEGGEVGAAGWIGGAVGGGSGDVVLD